MGKLPAGQLSSGQLLTGEILARHLSPGKLPLGPSSVTNVQSSNSLVQLCVISRVTNYHNWKPLSNAITHMKNGNRRGAGKVMKIATWNAGSAYLENKINGLESVVQSLSPHILVISECNLKL